MSRWARPLVLLLLCAWPATAGPVAQVWREAAGAGLALVTPHGALDGAWVGPALAGVKLRTFGPTEIQVEWAKPTLPRRLYLIDRRSLDLWPEPVLLKLQRDPRTLPPDQVLVCARQVQRKYWETLIVAPNELELQTAARQLFALDSSAYDQRPDELLAWRLIPALGIGSEAVLLKAWLAARTTARQRLAVTLTTPERVTTAQLRPARLVVTALTQEQWQALPPAQQAVVAAALPPRVREAAGQPAVAATGWERVGETEQVAALAPQTEVLAALLSPPEPDGALSDALQAAPALQALWLNGPQSGGITELPDLRAYAEVALAPLGNGRDGQGAAQELSDRVRLALEQTTGWRFIDDRALSQALLQRLREGALSGREGPLAVGDAARQGGSAELLLAVRLHEVGGRTEYLEGEQRCLTPAPGKFNRSEPTRPDPEDREYGWFGPKKYEKCNYKGKRDEDGSRSNDPEYKDDLAEWESEHDSWERDRAEHERGLRRVVCEWEQTRVAIASATVAGVVDVHQRDGLLVCSVPLRVTQTRRSSELRRTQAVGWGTRPAALTLPAALPYAPTELISTAVERAAAQAALGLRLRAVLPLPGAQPAEPDPPAETSSPQEPERLVTVTAAAPLERGEAAALEQARNDALRLAVEQVAGTYVSADTVVDRGALVRDLVISRAAGFAALRREVAVERGAGELRLTCEVAVRSAPIREALAAAGLTRQWRVLVLINDPTADARLTGHLLRAKLRLVDRGQATPLRQQTAALSADRLRELARLAQTTTDAEILVLGDAAAEDAGQVHGLPHSRGRLDLKVIDVASGDVLLADNALVSGLDTTQELAGKAALRAAADSLAERTIDAVYRRPMPTAGQARITLRVAGFSSYAAAQRFRTALEGLPTVREVRQVEFRGGTLGLEVELNHALADKLPLWLETEPALVSFGCRIGLVTAGAIEATVQTRPDR